LSLVHLNFCSKYLNGNTDVNIILPTVNPFGSPSFEEICATEKYPVLWLLHGTFSDYSSWVRNTNIERYANEAGLIVVMPTALNSGYSDWSGFGVGFNMFTYLTEELMPLVQAWFPVSKDREHNFIGGFSSGGFGAMKYGFEHPHLFKGMIVLSAPAYDVSKVPLDPASPDYVRAKNEIDNFGDIEGFYNSIHNPAYSIRRYVETGQDLDLYFACGRDDFLYDKHVEFQELAEELQLKATIETFDHYAHDFKFWDMAIQRGINHVCKGER
jgi:putative tributyrin esterase